MTTKKVQILRLIADGASNKDITEELLISSRTTKTHVYDISKKISEPTGSRLRCGRERIFKGEENGFC